MTNSIQNQNPTQGVFSSSELPKAKSATTEADHMMYLGMMAMIENLGRSEELGASLANLSKTIYDTIVMNGTEKVKALRDKLNALGDVLEQWDNIFFWANYNVWAVENVTKYTELKKELKELEEDPFILDPSNPNHQRYLEVKEQMQTIMDGRPYGANVEPDIFAENMLIKYQYPLKQGARGYVNGVTQQLSLENTAVSSNKKLGDSLQTQVQGLVTDQGMLASEITSIFRIIQRQLQYGFGHK